jgi:glycosyltransferase involved in cell wall biosynthesis
MIAGHTVGLVIPCHNEADGLRKLLPSVPKDIDDVLVVDNHSTDETANVARSHDARVVFEVMPGYGRAYQAGFAAARSEILVTMDGDGQYPLADIPRLVQRFLDRKLDFLSACRFPVPHGSMPLLRRIGNAGLTLATVILFGKAIRDSQSGMWVFRRDLLTKIRPHESGMAFSEEIKLKAILAGGRFGEEYIPYLPRIGESKLSRLGDGWKNLLYLFRLRLSTLRSAQVASALVVLVVLLPLLSAWVRGAVLLDLDLASIVAPIEDMFARSQRHGDIPFWAPELQMGYPLVAISHMGFFYPLHILLRQFLPGILTLNVSLAVHALLGAIGMMLALRDEGRSRAAAALGAFVFAGTGFFVGHMTTTNVLLPLLWTPLGLFFLGRWLRRRSIASLLGLSVTVALSLLIGQPQAALIGSAVLAVFFFSRLLTNPGPSLLRAFPLLPAAALALALSVVQLLPTLALIPNSDRADALSTRELSEFSFPLHHVVSWVLPQAFGHHDTYIGSKGENELATWMGVTILLIAAVGALEYLRTDRRSAVFPALLTAGALALGSGASSPVYRFLIERQWLENLAVPTRWMFLLVVAMAYMTARGVDALAEPTRPRSRTLAAAILLTMFLAASATALPAERAAGVRDNLRSQPLQMLMPAVAAVVGLGFALHARMRARPLAFLLLAGAELTVPNLSFNMTVPLSTALRRTEAETIIPRGDLTARVFSQANMSLLPPARHEFAPWKRLETTMLLQQDFRSFSHEIRGVELLFSWPKGTQGNGSVSVTLEDPATGQMRQVSLPAAEILNGEWTRFSTKPLPGVLNHHVRVTVRNTFASHGPRMHLALNDKDADLLPGGSLIVCAKGSCAPPDVSRAIPERVDLATEPLTSPANELLVQQNLLSAHIGAGRNIPSTQWLGALQLHDVKRYLYAVGDQNENVVDHNPLLHDRRDMLNRLGVKYLLGSQLRDRDLQSLENVTLLAEYPLEGRWVRVYQNNEAFPRVQFAHQVVSADHADTMYELLKKNATPGDTVIARDDGNTQGVTFSEGEAAILREDPTHVEIHSRSAGTGFLVLRDTFFPDWHADIDGVDTRIYSTDLIFRGVMVPAGEHIVRFRYEPADTVRALRVSGVSWAGVILVAALLWLRRTSGWHMIRKNSTTRQR